MKAQTSLFSLLLMTAMSGVADQSLPRDADLLLARPLNLSLRKQTAPTTNTALIVIAQPTQTTSQMQNASIGGNEEADTAASLPYGVGFENRQQGSASNSGNAGNGNSAGNGGGGRGGAGRGR
jgi:uncharacterized membrane protein YgcG